MSDLIGQTAHQLDLGHGTRLSSPQSPGGAVLGPSMLLLRPDVMGIGSRSATVVVTSATGLGRVAAGSRLRPYMGPDWRLWSAAVMGTFVAGNPRGLSYRRKGTTVTTMNILWLIMLLSRLRGLYQSRISSPRLTQVNKSPSAGGQCDAGRCFGRPASQMAEPGSAKE